MIDVTGMAALWNATLHLGESERSRCPACRAPEKSFVVTKLYDGSLAWVCHRASCSFRGRSDPATYLPRTTGAADVSTHKSAPPLNLVPTAFAYLINRFGIPHEALEAAGIYFDTLSQRTYFPIFASDGTVTGFQLRAYDGSLPKVQTYVTRETEYARMSWYRHRPLRSRTVVLVEDIVSAIKLQSLGHDAVALLGTHLNAGRVRELNEHYRHCVLWLDSDALQLALDYQARYRLYFLSLHVVASLKDPKDLSAEEIKKMEKQFGTSNYCGANTEPDCL